MGAKLVGTRFLCNHTDYNRDGGQGPVDQSGNSKYTIGSFRNHLYYDPNEHPEKNRNPFFPSFDNSYQYRYEGPNPFGILIVGALTGIVGAFFFIHLAFSSSVQAIVGVFFFSAIFGGIWTAYNEGRGYSGLSKARFIFAGCFFGGIGGVVGIIIGLLIRSHLYRVILGL
jgi:hypothetical protein